MEALKIADAVYKRCYQQKYINSLPIEFSSKLKQMGLPFMVRPNKIIFNYKFVFLFFIFRFKELVKLDRFFFRRLKSAVKLPYKQWITFLNTRTANDFNNVSKMELSNFKDKDVIDLIEQLKPTKLNQGLTSKTILKVTFKNLPTLIGFYIKGEETGQITEDIFYVFETRSKLNLFITREKTGFGRSYSAPGNLV